MSSLLKFIGSSLVALIAAGSLSAAELEIGRAFPDLKGYALEGALPDRNDKVLLLDFWATWCGPCKSSFPVYNSLQKEFSAQGFTIVAVSVDKDLRAYDDFLKRLNPTFPTLRDPRFEMAAAFDIPSVPASYLIDRRGILRARFRGFHGKDTVRELRAEITRLLEEKP